ncbi:MAG TPA: hypothetical protein VIV11_04695 [Kofleriaceae bacterium]
MTLKIVLVAALAACRSPAPAAPTPAPTCTLQRTLAAPPPGARVCNEDRGGVCGFECQHRVHECLLTSLRAKQPFVVRWTNNLIDGVGTQEAIIGTLTDDRLDVRWYEFTVVSGHDRRTDTMGDTHFAVTVRTCDDIVPGTDDRVRDDLDLHCTPDGEPQPVCSETFEPQ